MPGAMLVLDTYVTQIFRQKRRMNVVLRSLASVVSDSVRSYGL